MGSGQRSLEVVGVDPDAHRHGGRRLAVVTGIAKRPDDQSTQGNAQ
jgi:hypothetical protein